MTRLKEDISLPELIEMQWLSVRARRVCQNSGLLSLKEIFAFYEKNGSFTILNACGNKTNLQLTDLCEKYKVQKFRIEIPKKEKDVYSVLCTLSLPEQQKLSQFTEMLILGLGTRARNGLKELYPSGNPVEMLKVIYKPGFRFRQLKNIGVRASDEFERFSYKISDFIRSLPSPANHE